MSSLSDETRNYFKLVRLLDRSCILLRQFFKTRYSQSNNGAIWDDSSTCGQSIFINMSRKNQKKCELVKKTIENGNTNQWDLSILLILLLEIYKSTMLNSNEIEQLEKLIVIRNKIEHHSTLSMAVAEFNQMWNDLSQILLSFGDITSTEIDELKNDNNIFNARYQIIDEENVKKAEQFNSEGTKAHQAERYSEAIEKFTKAIDLSGISDDNRAVFYTNRSASLLKLYEQQLSSTTKPLADINDLRYNALQDAKKGRDLSLKLWKGHYRVGQVYTSLNEHKKAKHSFELAFALSPLNETIKKALDESTSIYNRQLREEHLDPRVSPGSIAQLFNEAKRLLGTDIAQIRFQLSLLEKIDPVAAAVFKGHQYRYGDEGIEQNYELAVKYYTEAAEQGNAEGIYNLAYLIDRGLGVKKDLVRAHKLYEQAAAQRSEPLEYGRRRNVGVAESEYEIGLRYAEGIVVHKNLPMASIWYQRAVDHESDAAANNLAEMYEKGIGVVQNYGKAQELYEIAARRGDPNAMYSLVELALGEGNFEMAEIWHERASNAGNIKARTNFSKFQTIYQKLQQIRDTSPPMFSKLMNYKNKHLDSLKMYDSVSTLGDSNSTRIYDVPMLMRSAAQGSITAKRILSALEHFNLADDLILSNEHLTEAQENEFVHELAQCYYTEHIVAKFNPKTRKLYHDTVDHVLRRCNSNSTVDEDARVCYSLLNLDKRDLIEPFLDECIARYPKNIFFYGSKADLYGWLEKFDKSIYEANRGLEIDPNHSDLLFTKATALRILEQDLNEAITAYKLFIKKAPQDHRHMPDAFYEMCQCYRDDNIRKELYKQGKEAEKLQLSCFLPYESNARESLESLFNIKSLFSTESTVSSKQRDYHLKNPHRIEIIVEQRHWKSFLLKTKQKSTIMSGSYSLPPRIRQKAPKSLVGLKSISIREMDPRKDHMYQGRVLTVKIIEDALHWKPSIHLIVEDESFDCERLYIYNCSDDQGEYLIKQVYTLGRQMHDAKPTIRIDDLTSIVMEDQSEETRPKHVCQCCGKLNAPHACSRCRRTRYCSRECQIFDWKTYEHKLICQNY